MEEKEIITQEQPQQVGLSGATWGTEQAEQEQPQQPEQAVENAPVIITKKPRVGKPITKPLFIPYSLAELMIKKSAIRHKKEIERKMQDGKISFVLDSKGRVFNSFNNYAEIMVWGLFCELDRQTGNGLQQYMQVVTKWNKENRAIERENAKIDKQNRENQQWNAANPYSKQKKIQSKMALIHPKPYRTTRSSGFHIAGYDATQIEPQELALLQQRCNIQPNEPFVIIDIPQFCSDYLGINIKGEQYMFYRNILADIGKTDFVYIDETGFHSTQLFVTHTDILTYSQKAYTVIRVNPMFFNGLQDRYFKLSENVLSITKQLGGGFGLRLYFKFLEEYRKNYKRRKPIVMHYDIKELICDVAEETDIQNRRWNALKNKLYKQLEMLKKENVLLDYTQEQFNSDGKITITINHNPFSRNILNE